MGRELWITMLSFFMLILRLSVSQPSANSLSLTRLQTHLITLYNQYRQNVSAVHLQRYMNFRLMTRTNGLIDLIRGWSPNATEELINVRTSMDYIRSIVLYMCIAYADSLYDLYSSAGGIDANVILHATEIYQIRSNFVWTLEPSDEIVRFEIMQFHQFGVRLRLVHFAPYIRLFTTSYESARFFDHTIDPRFPSFMLLRQDPQSNLLREVQMLMNVQNLVLSWDTLRIVSLSRLPAQLFFSNSHLRCTLNEFIITFSRQRGMQIPSQNKVAFELLSLVVLQRCMRFVHAEYVRHANHPAHLRYAYALSANVTTLLNENHIRLEHAYQNLNAALDALASSSGFLSELLPQFSALALRVGYVKYNGWLTLRIGPSCRDSEDENLSED